MKTSWTWLAWCMAPSAIILAIVSFRDHGRPAPKNDAATIGPKIAAASEGQSWCEKTKASLEALLNDPEKLIWEAQAYGYIGEWTENFPYPQLEKLEQMCGKSVKDQSEP